MAAGMNDANLKRELASKGEFLRERLRNSHDDCLNANVAEDRMSSWETLYSTDDANYFERRVANCGVPRQEIEQYLGPGQWPTHEGLPAWTDDALDLVRSLEATLPKPERGNQRSPVEPTPYAEFFEGIVTYVEDETLDEWSTDYGDCSSVDASLREGLIKRLLGVSGRSLHTYYRLFLLETDAGEPGTLSPERSHHYDEFLKHLSNGGVRQLFQAYPLLPRHLLNTIEEWRSVSQSFLDRLESDRAALEEHFDIPSDATVSDVSFDMGDRHERGKSVLVVVFETEHELVYKPKNLSCELVVNEVIDRITEYDSVPDLRTPTVLSNDDYGWVEFLEMNELDDFQEVKMYYERVGALLCALYVLRVSDCHYENIVSHGAYPAVIDCETLLSQQYSIHHSSNRRITDELISDYVTDTVLNSFCIPYRTKNQDKEFPDIAAFGTSTVEAGYQDSLSWKNLGTNAIKLEFDRDPVDTSQSLPTLHGDEQFPTENIDAIIRGFESAYNTINKQVHDIFDDELLTTVEEVEIRVLIRQTWIYQSIIDTITDPAVLKSGALHSIKLDLLKRSVLISNDPLSTVKTSVLQAELESVSRLNIPRFTAQGDSTTIYFNGTELDGKGLQHRPVDLLHRRLASLSQADLARQTDLIEAAYSQDLLVT